MEKKPKYEEKKAGKNERNVHFYIQTELSLHVTVLYVVDLRSNSIT